MACVVMACTFLTCMTIAKQHQHSTKGQMISLLATSGAVLHWDMVPCVQCIVLGAILQLALGTVQVLGTVRSTGQNTSALAKLHSTRHSAQCILA